MKAVILTAGKGSRLYPLTKDKPKGMIEVNGKSIIERQIAVFKNMGIEDIIIIKGYKAENVLNYGMKSYVNSYYDTTNMVYTLFCAQEEMDEDIVVSYGDILYEEDVLKELLKSNGDISVVIDLDWKKYYEERFVDPYSDAESLIYDDNFIIKNIGKSSPKHENIQGQYIGLMKFKKEGLRIIKDIYNTAITKNDEIGWGRPIRKAYMTDLLQEIINKENNIYAVPINGGWVEVDSLRDYEIACDRF